MNFLEVGRQIAALNRLADSYHFDIMDCHFANSFGLPLEFLRQIKSVSSLPIDVHLMVEDVERTVQELLNIGVGTITFPIETVSSNAFSLISRVKSAATNVGIAVNPVTPIEHLKYVLPLIDKVTVMTFDPGVSGQKLVEITLTKVTSLVELRKINDYKYDIEVDGSCNKANFKNMFAAGANQFVVGSSGLFRLHNDIEMAWRKMKEYMND
jgi:D-allulose-6-phosphate 3-epimerase